MCQSGIGGDDKCGIYAALTLCLEGRANAAFFRDEEIGCLGSSQVDISYIENALYVLQADRQGNSDFVKYIGTSIASQAFTNDLTDILSHYGYALSTGMMTDVMELSRNGIGVSCANISAGYYNPHTDQEFICLHSLENCVNMMRDITISLTDRYAHVNTWKPYVYEPTANGKPLQRDFDDSLEVSDYDLAYPEDLTQEEGKRLARYNNTNLDALTVTEWNDYEALCTKEHNAYLAFDAIDGGK